MAADMKQLQLARNTPGAMLPKWRFEMKTRRKYCCHRPKQVLQQLH
jgi:hypothetical protein